MKSVAPFLAMLMLLLSQCTGGSAPGPVTSTDPAEYNLFEDMPSYYYFSSGVGGWGTELYLYTDGSFSGEYHDSDMGDAGDGYPNGTLYYCDFSGRFSQPVQIDDHTWSMYLVSLEYEPPGEPYIDDGTLWVPSTPYGLESAYEIRIFLPGTPVSSVPEDFMFWDFADYGNTELTCWGLYNVSEGLAFVS